MTKSNRAAKKEYYEKILPFAVYLKFESMPSHELLGRCKSLRKLTLRYTNVNDTDLVFIGTLNLTYLDLSGCGKIKNMEPIKDIHTLILAGNKGIDVSTL